jgi:hypothetical protein
MKRTVKKGACTVALAVLVAGCGSSGSPSSPKKVGWTSVEKTLFMKTCSGPEGINGLFKGTKNSMSKHQINRYCAKQLQLAQKYNPHHRRVAKNGYVGAYTVTN